MEQIILKNILHWIKLSSFRDHQLSVDPTEMKQSNFFRDYKNFGKKVNFQISKMKKKFKINEEILLFFER